LKGHFAYPKVLQQQSTGEVGLCIFWHWVSSGCCVPKN